MFYCDIVLRSLSDVKLKGLVGLGRCVGVGGSGCGWECVWVGGGGHTYNYIMLCMLK